MAQRAEVIIYAISTDDSGLVMRGDKVLEQLAEATGGRAFFPFKMKDITHSFAAIQDELRSQYVVSYKPANFDADGRYRSIEISSLKKDCKCGRARGTSRRSSSFGFRLPAFSFRTNFRLRTFCFLRLAPRFPRSPPLPSSLRLLDTFGLLKSEV